MCTIPKPIDGECGTDVNMCLAGDVNDIDDSTTDFLWNCDGQHGGAPAMCTIPKPIDGECGEEVNMCLKGILNDIDDTDTDNLWELRRRTRRHLRQLLAAESGCLPERCRSNRIGPLFCERGDAGWLIPGINQLPLDRVQLTNEQVQKHFAIAEVTPGHARVVGIAACESYVTASEGCELMENRAGITRHPEGDEETRTGLTPFTQILDATRGIGIEWKDEQIDAMQDLRILNVSAEPNQHYLGDADKPYLQIRSAGNGGHNGSWFFRDGTSDHIRDLFTKANAANKLLFVAGMDRDVNSNYIRHPDSSSCRDVDYGCLWTWYVFGGGGGTSYSAPNIAASLASILSIFPDTEHQDLAKLARACAKKNGRGD